MHRNSLYIIPDQTLFFLCVKKGFVAERNLKVFLHLKQFKYKIILGEITGWTGGFIMITFRLS